MDGKAQDIKLDKPQRYIFIDTETTGLDPEVNDVIEVAALVMEESEDGITELARFSGKLGVTDGIVDIEALAVNKRRVTDDIFTPNELKVDIVNAFADFLAEFVTSTTFIVGGNTNFDIDFIKALFKKYGLDSTRILSKKKAIDIQHVAKFLHDSGVISVPNFRMATLVWEILGKQTWTHTAMQDVVDSKDLYFEMRELV